MAEPLTSQAPRSQRVLVLGEGRLIGVVRRELDRVGADVIHLRAPNDREIRRALTADIDAVVVISRDDRVSLRLALIVEGVRPGVRLIVTIYNLDLGDQVRRAVRNVRVMSMADVVAPSLAGPCLAAELIAVSRSAADEPCGIQAGRDGPMLTELDVGREGLVARVRANATALLHPFELSAKTLTAGMLGLVAILLIDTIVIGLTLSEPPIEAIYLAVRTLVTVGPNTAIEHGPDWLKLFTAATMLAALAATAVFTAGLINRLLGQRHVAMFGRRAMPRRNHVVVVGLGQVGLRLCLALRELGIPVIAVERDRLADNVARAKRYGIPVVIGAGGSRGVLRRLCLARARALAAVSSDEIENISTAVAALALREDLPTVLRAGTGDLMDETRALFRIGVVRDVYLIGGTVLAAAALGSQASEAFPYDDTIQIIGAGGALEPFAAHVGASETG
ncbi:MAG: NAD-binding protein [Solirubrobacteraceae bacterium]|nr:NAD-binding protein [Solirubrobacteraceae bacterium]